MIYFTIVLLFCKTANYIYRQENAHVWQKPYIWW